ncbi:MAG: trehalose-phosphatase [Actinomycetes bacterium]
MPRGPRRLSRRRARSSLRPLAALAPDLGIVLDFDGSLAPIVDDPDAAIARPEAIAALTRLTGRVRPIAVVSGRPVGFLRRAVPVPGAVLIGQYGLEREGPGTATLVDPRAVGAWGSESVTALATRARRDLPGVRVEEKGAVAVALHWREQPELGAEAERWGRAAAAATGLLAVPGRLALELRPDLAVDKGTVVRELVLDGPRPLRGLLVAGDDHGDLPAFDAAGRLCDEGVLERVLRIGVRSIEAPAALADHTDLTVAGPHGLSQCLGLLARLLGG